MFRTLPRTKARRAAARARVLREKAVAIIKDREVDKTVSGLPAVRRGLSLAGSSGVDVIGSHACCDLAADHADTGYLAGRLRVEGRGAGHPISGHR